MSYHFRMVSSSPPPLDDGACFEDDDADDEFGTFSSVGHPMVDERVSLERDDAPAPPSPTDALQNPPPATDTEEHAWNEEEKLEGRSHQSDGAQVEVQVEDGVAPTPDPAIAESSPDSPGTTFRTATAADGASQDSVSDSGLCSGSQLSDATFVDESPVTGAESVESPEAARSRDGDDDNDDNDDESDTPDDRICGDGTSQDGDYPRNLGDNDNVDDDDFADFAGFERDSTFKMPPPNLAGDDFDDDFDDFREAELELGSVAPVEEVGHAAVSDAELSIIGEFENFATFDEFRFQAPDPVPFIAKFTGGLGSEVEGEEDDEFGNFDCAQPVDAIENDQILNAVGETLSLTFPAEVVRADASVSTLDEALGPTLPDASDDNDGPAGAKQSGVEGVWSQLYDIDSTHALTYRWTQSRSNQKLLRSLHIDSRNLLHGTKWHSSIPLFAATMSLNPLEPTKAVARSGPAEEERNLGGVTTAAILGGAAAVAVSNGSCILEPSMIPPAQFDWSSSGLVNPLDDSASTLLDLDFFLTNLTNDALTSGRSSKFTKLESELLGNDAGASSGNGGRAPRSVSGVQRASPLLEQILRQAAVSTASTFQQTRRRSPNLSQEARAILDSLPDLSFMRAKVLMFPIRSAVVP